MTTPLSKCVFISKATIVETLSSAATPGKRLLEPLKTIARENQLPINILEDSAVSSSDFEVHRHEGDLWHCVEGEVTFVYGGELIAPQAKKLADGSVDDQEIKAHEVSGGTEIVLKPGDWLWIPAGQPHAHKSEGTARLAIIKIPAREIVPLDAIPGWVRGNPV